MKAIFVARGNKKIDTISPFSRTQYDSLRAAGLDVTLYPIKGKGAKAYLNAIKELHKILKTGQFDVIHGNFSTTGYAVAMAAIGTRTKVVVSILGSFPKDTFRRRLVKFFTKHIWDKTCVQSQETSDHLGIPLPVIPTGINLDKFQIDDQQHARQLCGFDPNKRYIVWCSDPSRPEKDFPLAEAAVQLLNRNDVVLVPVFDRSHSEVVTHLCAADMLLLTSTREGSPNVVKEAMTVNCPVVATAVGDVPLVLGNTPGTYLCTEHTPQCVAANIAKALDFNQRTQGRERIIALGLTSTDIAQRIIQFYESSLN